MRFYYCLLVVEKCLEKFLLVNYLMFLRERINGKQISFNRPIILSYWLAGQHKLPHTRTFWHKKRTQFTLELGKNWMSLLAASKNNCVCRSNVVCRSGSDDCQCYVSKKNQEPISKFEFFFPCSFLYSSVFIFFPFVILTIIRTRKP